MECKENVIHYLSWGFIVGAVAYLLQQTRTQTPYGRYVTLDGTPGRTCPAKLAWFLQELPSFLVPMLLLLSTDTQPSLGKDLLLWTFCLHYFQRYVSTLAWSPICQYCLATWLDSRIRSVMVGRDYVHIPTFNGVWDLLTHKSTEKHGQLFFGQQQLFHLKGVEHTSLPPTQLICVYAIPMQAIQRRVPYSLF